MPKPSRDSVLCVGNSSLMVLYLTQFNRTSVELWPQNNHHARTFTNKSLTGSKRTVGDRLTGSSVMFKVKNVCASWAIWSYTTLLIGCKQKASCWAHPGSEISLINHHFKWNHKTDLRWTVKEQLLPALYNWLPEDAGESRRSTCRSSVRRSLTGQLWNNTAVSKDVLITFKALLFLAIKST